MNEQLTKKNHKALKAMDEIMYYNDMANMTNSFQYNDYYSDEFNEIQNNLQNDKRIINGYRAYINEKYRESKPFLYLLHGESRIVDPSDEDYFEKNDELNDKLGEVIDNCENLLTDEGLKKINDGIVKNMTDKLHEQIDADNSKCQEIVELYGKISEITVKLRESSIDETDKWIDELDNISHKIERFKLELDEAYRSEQSIIVVSSDRNLSNAMANIIYFGSEDYEKSYQKQLRAYNYLLNSFEHSKGWLNSRKQLESKEVDTLESTIRINKSEIFKEDEDKTQKSYDNGGNLSELTVASLLDSINSKDKLDSLFDEYGANNIWNFISDSLDNKGMRFVDYITFDKAISKLYTDDEINEKKIYGDSYKKLLEKHPLPVVDIDRLFRTAKYKSKGAIKGIVNLYGGYDDVWDIIKNDLDDKIINNSQVDEFIDNLKNIYSEEELDMVFTDEYKKNFENPSFEILTEDPMKKKKEEKKGFFAGIKESISKIFGGEKPKGKKVKRDKLKKETVKKIKQYIDEHRDEIAVVAASNIGMVVSESLINGFNENSIVSNASDIKILDENLNEDKNNFTNNLNGHIDIINEDLAVFTPDADEFVVDSSADVVNDEDNDELDYFKIAVFDTETGEWILLSEKEIKDEEYMRNLNEMHGGRLNVLLGGDYEKIRENIDNANGWIKAPDDGGRSR